MDPEIEALVDDILEQCVAGYQRPERKALKRKPVVKTKDGFEGATPKRFEPPDEP